MSSSSILLSIIIFITLLIMAICCQSKNNNVTFDCLPGERKALLRLKASFSDDPSNRLTSWKANSECCSWAGIECDNTTGHVVKLDISNGDVDEYGDFRIPERSRLKSDTIDSSILKLKYLSYLDLSGNDFQSSLIPTFLGSMKQLQFLYLSNALFSGIVPHQLGNLSSLRELDVGGEHEYLRVDDVTWAGNLLLLKYLDMSDVDLGETKDVVYKVLNILPSLVDLSLSSCGLDDTNLLHSYCVNSTLLVTNVQSLYVSHNSFGENPSFCFLHNMTSLSYLDLSHNSIHQKADWISDLLWDKCHLKLLNLNGNRFYGDISEALIKNLSGCWSRNLEIISFEGNEFDGHFPEELGELKQLIYLDVFRNKLSGPIPSSIGNLKALRVLDLSSNQLGGEIPVSLKNCTLLSFLDIGDNKLTGKLPEGIGNHLTLLRVLRLRNNKLDGNIPSAYCRLSRLQIMDLALNQLTGSIPHCFGSLSGMIHVNQGFDYLIADQGSSLNEMMKGVMLEYTRTLRYLVNLDLSSNHLIGDIPLELTNLIALNGLNLSYNHLGGQIPQRIGDLKSLESLDLSNNNLSGAILRSLTSLMSLSCLNLSNNNLSGPIPTGPQLQSLNDNSSYAGNPGLCGDPLMKKCHILNNEIPGQNQKVENDDGDMITDKIYMYAFITTGLATGFWGYFGVLFFKRSWRLALFRCMDMLIAKLLERY